MRLKCVSFSLLVLASVAAQRAALAGSTRVRRARLRREDVILGRLQDGDDNDGSSSGADVASKASTDGAAASGAGEPYANVGAWRGLPSLRLYLVGYDPRQPQALGEALEAHGASVLSYVPDDTWLVAGHPQAIRRVVKDTSAEAAPYRPELRVAPEWDPVEVLLAAEPGEGEGEGKGEDSQSSTAGEGAGTPSKGPASDRPGSRSLSQDTGKVLPRQRVEDRQALSRLLSSLRTLDSTPLHPAVGGRLDERRRRRRQLGEAGAGEPPAPPRYGVWVQLAGVVPAAALQAAEEDWPGALDRELGRGGGQGQVHGAGEGEEDGCQPVVVAPRSGRTGEVLDVATGAHGASLEVFFCEEDLRRGLRWLARQPLVTWVAPLEQLRANDAYASVLTQTGDITTAQLFSPLDIGARPYHAAGLTGAGEVVGVGDTGLDMAHCHFADSRYNYSSYSSLSQSVAGNVMIILPLGDHRKLVQYAVAPGAIFQRGDMLHGTHVAGSVAGSMQLQANPAAANLATGVAPLARMSFMDVGNGGTALSIPQPVQVNYLPVHTEVGGAFITSDSWAAAGEAYNAMSAGFDLFLWTNPMVASFLAAGNEGSSTPYRRATVGTPSTAKNTITVGAGFKWTRSDFTYSPDAFTVRGTSASGQETFQLSAWPKENVDLPKLKDVITNQPAPLVVATASAACSGLAGVVVTGAVVLVPRAASDTCTWTIVASAVQQAGGIALIVADNEADTLSPPDPAPGAASIPCSTIARQVGEWITRNASSSSRVTMARLTVPSSATSIPWYSSYGPLSDGRIKPDVIAPGTELLAAAGYDRPAGTACFADAVTLSGTSMATPTAAGHAALMRQYFREGYYPDGDPASPRSQRFAPSGMLLKALIIAGAKSMEGGMHWGRGWRLGPSPDGLQGWGRMSLAGSLPLPGATPSGFRLQVADMMQFTATGQSVTLGGLAATGSGPVTVVLVWYDYPADPTAASALVNDLDLEVAVGSGANTQRVLGNNADVAASPAPDRTNTVERVRLASPPAGAPLAVTVSAFRLRSANLASPDARLPQRFAVAVVGAFSGDVDPTVVPTSTTQSPKDMSSPHPSPRPSPTGGQPSTTTTSSPPPIAAPRPPRPPKKARAGAKKRPPPSPPAASPPPSPRPPRPPPKRQRPRRNTGL